MLSLPTVVPAIAIAIQANDSNAVAFLGDVPSALILGVAVVIVLLGLAMLFANRYVRCPANKILVISGRVTGEGAARCISGGGTFVWPVIQESAFLDLEPVRIDVKLPDALSLENIRISVPSVFTVAIGTDALVRQNAAIRLLNLTHPQVEATARDIIIGQLRAVIATMSIDQINRDREAFLQRVQHQLEPELMKVGLTLLNVNIQDLRDESGYLEALGKQAAAQAIQKARGDVAEQEKQGAIRVANAERDQSVSVAATQKDRDIGLEEANRERAVRIASIQKEQAVGEQQAGFERDMAVKDAERAKRVAVAAADAAAIAGEAESQGKVVRTQAVLAVTRAEATQQSEIAQRTAKAEVERVENEAQARAALARADRVEAERRAELEAPAKAEKARMIVQAEADAERVKIAAKAEAEATFARMDAEARGNLSIMEKKAEGLQKMVAAAGGNPDAAYRLLFLEQMPAVTETLAGAIANIKFDKVVLWNGSNGNGATGGVSSLVEDLVKVLPPLMQVAEEIGGVQLPGIFGKRIQDATERAATEAKEAAAAAMLEVPVKASMSVQAKRATD
ncbi:MAG TPA: SPFH domain-containing protein [Gemmatimonadaceae bacterium]|nr:SPFH domain-containing protein [Gemmatimonadaceae bacterium]